VTRRLLAFFAPGMLAAQTYGRRFNCDAFPEATVCGGSGGRTSVLQPRIPRPKNGQCPVCGTMAKPYVIPTGPTICDAIGAQAIFPNGNLRQSVKECNVRLLSRRIDCAHCNTTFRQWADGKEPKR